MEQGRYDMTLNEVPAQIVEIAQAGVPVGLVDRHMEPGFMLADGTALLESEKDEAGFYVGGTGMDGVFLRTPDRYEPVRDDDGNITAFRQMSSYVTQFTAEEQALIFSHALNTKDNLVEDLASALPALKKSPQVYDLFASTVKKLCQVPDSASRRLMADIRAAYKGREEQSIRDRQKAVQRSAQKKRRSFER